MHRLIAKFLLFLGLAGNLVPVALAIAAPPPHACCVRKALHPCHGSMAAETDQLLIRAANCCTRDCGRAVSTVRWACAQPSTTICYTQKVETHIAQRDRVSPNIEVLGFQSTRAPPHFSIA